MLFQTHGGLTLDSREPVLPAGEGVGDIGEGVLLERLLQLFWWGEGAWLMGRAGGGLLAVVCNSITSMLMWEKLMSWDFKKYHINHGLEILISWERSIPCCNPQLLSSASECHFSSACTTSNSTGTGFSNCIIKQDNW